MTGREGGRCGPVHGGASGRIALTVPGGRSRSIRAALLLVGVLLVGSCGVEELVLEPFRGETPHERYAERLERADLVETALGRDWKRAAAEALTAPLRADPPMIEEGWLPVEDPSALGYRVEMQRGQRLRVRLDLEEDEDARVFIDVFRVRGDAELEDPSLLTVAWADSLAREVTYDARTTSTFLVRVQPELLRGGAYRLTMELGASLAFPVEGRDASAIRSFFGAPRDGGAREHHGVDIFAPRGTPVLAASEGRVTRVQTTPIGGHVVWVRSEEHGHSEYYAHLDLQLVESGARVSPGDTLGLVGNTGNAVTTPPHLHFGIYSRGPVDPLPFLRNPSTPPATPRFARERLHEPARLSADGGTIRAGPFSGSEVVEAGEPFLPVHVLAGAADWVRVRLPDRRHGYVHAERIEPVETPVQSIVGGSDDVLRRAPGESAPGIRVVPANHEIAVLGQYGEWSWVRPSDGARPGWIRNGFDEETEPVTGERTE